jgi:tellurium resistance protein TerD
MIGLGWELRPGAQLDLDASVFMLGASGKIPADEYFVFYNNLKSLDGSVQHTGDNRSGVGDDDDEMILVNLPLVDSAISEILIVATIHEGAARRHNFGLLTDAYIRIVDVETQREVLRYDLDAEFTTNTDVEFGKLQRIEGEWFFTALGIGSNKGLEGYVAAFA